MRQSTRGGQGPRQRRTDEEKRRIVEETLVAGVSVSVVARRHDVNANQLFLWRRQYHSGKLGHGAALVPVGVIGEGGIFSGHSDLTKPPPARPSGSPAEPRSVVLDPPPRKMIEVELRSGTRIRIDADVKGFGLQHVLKLIRSLG